MWNFKIKNDKIMARYLFTRKAVEDLTGIYEYTLEFWSEVRPINIIMNESSFVRCWPKARELVNIMLKLAQIFLACYSLSISFFIECSMKKKLKF